MTRDFETVIDALVCESSLLDLCDMAQPALESLRCHPDLIEHLEELGRIARGALVFAAGCPVLIDRTSGLAFAAAWGTGTLVVRLGIQHPGVLASDAPRVANLDKNWWTIDPWPQDFTFQRGKDLVRDAVTAAATIRRV